MIKKVSKSFNNLGLPRSKSLNDASNKISSFIPISLSSPNKNSSKNPSFAQSYGAPITLDRFLTNEGHRLVASYLYLNQIQKDIQQGLLHKLTEKDINDLLRSYKGVTTNVYETLNYKQLYLSQSECKLLAILLKSDSISNVKHLRLSKNNLKGSSLKLVLESLYKNSTVITLDLSFNNLSNSDAKNLAKLIKRNKSIKELYIAHNNIEGEGVKHIARALQVNESIERLSIESNNLGVSGGKHIAEMLKVNNTLKYLHLGRNNLQFAGISYINESLKVNKSIVSLSLDTNNIRSTGVNQLAEVLKINKNLTHLYIPNNNIGNEGLEYISKALLQNTTLTYLDLEFNNIGAELSSLDDDNNNNNNNSNSNMDNDDENINEIGVKSLGNLLENHIVPKAINLSSNPIGNKGCELIFSGFHKNKTMESLSLSNCRIGSEGAKAINESLKLNDSLQNLSLQKNLRLGVDGHLLIADALGKNTSLKGLQLDYNFDEWESVGDIIQKCLTRNHFLQQEKYEAACRILNASRIILNAKQDYNNQRSSPELVTRQNKKIKLDELPIEIQEQILAFLDPKNVLTDSQVISIVKWSVRKDTLGSTMKYFLTKILGAYYPLTSSMNLWPTEIVDGGGPIINRFNFF